MHWRFKLLTFVFSGYFVVAFSYAASHHPQDFLETIKGSSNEGQQIVQHFCANCHAVQPLIQVGAPRIKQKEDWEPRVKKGMRLLLQHTMEGLNAMPPRGGCFECTDEQLTLAILAMLPPSLRKLFSFELKDHKKNN